jgi:RHS repeat-associated protein
VQFFRGTTSIGSDTTSPYSFNWTNVAAGSYALTARATDNNSGVTTSTVVNITVDAPPTVSITAPANNAVFLPSTNVTITATATDAGGSVSKVDFFDGATLIGTDTTSPYSIVWASPAPGTHTVTARATDNLGVATTSAIITVRIDSPATVSITAPANNAVIVAPASFSITASAADGDGTVSKVEFLEGATLLGTATAAPYSVSLNNVALGPHTYTARATDNNGAVTTSSSVSIIVNTAPTVSITSPAASTVFTAPTNITVNAAALDSDGTIAKVEFFDGSTLVGNATAAPYSATIVNAAGGTHSLTAKATDNRGTVTTSAAVSVFVDAPPTVSITAPANNAVVSAPASITITATASDLDGTVTKVDFFQGTTLLGSAGAAPYSIPWTNVAAGTYNLTAVATDDRGVAVTSAIVTLIVNSLPSVTLDSPAFGASFIAPASIQLSATASDPGGAVSKVDFYQGATLIGAASAAPYTFSWTNVAAGDYNLTAVATDSAGGTATSAAVTIRVNANAVPTVVLSSPTGGANFTAPANITIAAAASDTDGTISSVAFYFGTTPIATSSTPPYAITWGGVPQGSYTLTAVATDNLGATATSAPVTVTVNAVVAQIYYIHTDHLNTPRLVADASGSTVWKWDQQEPFGVSPVDENPSGLGLFKFPLRYPGQYDDPETGLFYNYLRDCYDPATGRYCQSDPIGLRGGLNTYGYVGGNPISLSDPSGLCMQAVYAGPFIMRWISCGEPNPSPTGTYPDRSPVMCYPDDPPPPPPPLPPAPPNPRQDAIESVCPECWLLGGARGWQGGIEMVLGRNLRIAPFGNRTGNLLGELPHYHRRILDEAGKTIPGGGIGRHRPWEGF